MFVTFDSNGDGPLWTSVITTTQTQTAAVITTTQTQTAAFATPVETKRHHFLRTSTETADTIEGIFV